MTNLVKEKLDFLLDRTFRDDRDDSILDITDRVENLDAMATEAMRVCSMLAWEQPLFYGDDWFGFNRTRRHLPVYATSDGRKSPTGGTGNTTLNFRRVMDEGLLSRLEDIQRRMPTADNDARSLYDALIAIIRAILDLSERMRVDAEKAGCMRLAAALKQVPAGPARSLYEACLTQKILLYALRCAGHCHTTLGRFDQYMWDFYQADMEKGVKKEELLELIELYFISLNMDTDLYIGIQQGDNGQSMVLGGFDLEGNSQFNDLSDLCMEASLELCLIDPKINLRVGKNTPDSLYEYGSRLTAKCLGFPQYCNDDVVVPGLIALGYDPQDAVDYGVAACWEYIVPDCAMDNPNIATMNFPLVVGNAIRDSVNTCARFEDLLECVKQELCDECDRLINNFKFFRMRKGPMLSLLTDGCIENGRDVSDGGAKYNNYGCHGAGISNAADALAAVKKLVYEEQSVSAAELLAALEANFDGYEALRNRLLDCPKMGNNDPYADDLAAVLMDTFSAYLNGKDNGHNGIWRAGTGSAMEYILSAERCPATADGRRAGDPYASSFSPALTTRLNGPLSTIQSFTSFNMERIINGGPLTMEIHDTVFRNPQGIQKTAMLVKSFIALGGHQLQLNALRPELLREAQEHPENYPNLIVRVWGWSGYFCELDTEYQNHIIRRTAFGL